jgi:hypothetical protein
MAFLFVKNSNKIGNNRARQICPKIPSISSYQGKFTCQSMVRTPMKKNEEIELMDKIRSCEGIKCIHRMEYHNDCISIANGPE